MNSALRGSREAAGLSRQELAELVNSYLWDRHAQRVELDAHYVAKLERGVISWPNSRYREAFRSVLGAADDVALGFHTARRTVPPRGPRATPWDVEQITASARMFAVEQHRHGGWWLREAALAQLRWATGLLPDDRAREAVGYLAYVCAFMCFDTSAPADARRYFELALKTTRDWSMRATILSAVSRQETWSGHPDAGLTAAELALVRADRLSATQRAMLFAARARAFAGLGRTQEALRDIGTADDEFARADPGLEPPAMRFYDERQHLGDTGEALSRLRPLEAHRRLHISVEGCSASYARSKLLAQVKLATVTMAAGDPAEGTRLGLAAAAASDSVRSDRLTEEFRRLGVHARRHREAAELVARLPIKR